MGIALAFSEKTVVCIIGDGSFQYSVQALWTAVQHNIKVLVIVLNNREYSAMKGLSLTFKANNPPSYSLPKINISDIVKGYGCIAEKASNARDLELAIHNGLKNKTTTVIDVTINKEIKSLYS